MSAVPYKAYQSKRHSRNLSNTFTPPQSPPLVPVGSPSKPPTLQSSGDSYKRLSIPSGNLDAPVSESIQPAAPSPPARVASPPKSPPPPVQLPPAPAPIVAPVSILEVPPSPISEPPTSPRIVDEKPDSTPNPAAAEIITNTINHAEAPSPSTSTIAFQPSTAAPAPAVPKTLENEEADSVKQPRPRQISHSSSTFRHIPARASPLRVSSTTSSPFGSYTLPSSQLVPASPTRASLTPSSSQLRTRTIGTNAKVLDFSSTPASSALPSPLANENQTQIPSSLSIPAASRPAAPSPLASSSSLRLSKPTTPLATSPRESAGPIPPSKSNTTSPSPSASPSRPSTGLPSSSSTSTVRPSTPTSNSTRPNTIGSAPYRHGFQPKGVYGIRTDEFLEARRTKRDVARIEDRRLERRLEKLIDLHFLSPSKTETNGTEEHKPPANRRQSSFFDFDLSDLKGKNASDLWRGVLDSATASRLGSGKNEIRQQEMAITPWQEDSAVPACPYCLASFNTLTNRKHHCRLCGKVVCSLPIKPPNRPELCSFLFVVDPKTGNTEEVGGDIVDYGVKRRDPTPGKDALLAKKLAEEQEKYLKGVRICRQCRPALRRRQYATEAKSTTPFSRLYDALLSLEKEIEEMLPQFQEIVIRLSQEEETTTPQSGGGALGSQNSLKNASNLRKRLLESFSQYDAIAKRIAGLKTSGPGSSQEKVQNAVANRATLFLQKNLFPLQALPKPKHTHSKNNSATTISLPANLMEISDRDAALAHTLQPLLEQEALLESFIEEATAQRKFEDAKTLKMNLKEIRSEIDRLLNGRDLAGPKTS